MRRLMLMAMAVPLLGQEILVNVRSRVELYKGTGQWEEVQIRESLDTRKTAIILCDVWDRHWCRGATERVAELAPAIERLVRVARGRGVLIIHAPSDTMGFYKDAPQRRAMMAMPVVAPPEPLGITSPALPIDDSDWGVATRGTRRTTSGRGSTRRSESPKGTSFRTRGRRFTARCAGGASRTCW